MCPCACMQQVLKALEALLLLLITEETALSLSLSCYKLRAPLSLRNTSATLALVLCTFVCSSLLKVAVAS